MKTRLLWSSHGTEPASDIVCSPRRAPMPVDPELLEILACPACKTPVVLVHDGQALKCNQCHRVYAIKDDIPIMLIDEATIEEGNP